jgi:[ribosomal protein S5]-alanine N-acetyltransferase
VELSTERLLLRELEESDAQRMSEIESLPEVWRYLEGERRTLEKADEYICGIITEASVIPRRVFDFAVTLDGLYIGRCGMGRNDRELRAAMLWYSLDPAYHGKGYATEAARAVLKLGFEQLGLHRIWADADPRNPPSIRVMERLGLRREAHHIENVCIRGEWCDSVIYAMLRSEWNP